MAGAGAGQQIGQGSSWGRAGAGALDAAKHRPARPEFAQPPARHATIAQLPCSPTLPSLVCAGQWRHCTRWRRRLWQECSLLRRKAVRPVQRRLQTAL
jgi:hypothetical protein